MWGWLYSRQLRTFVSKTSSFDPHLRETVDWVRCSGPRRYFCRPIFDGPIVSNESRIPAWGRARPKGLATDTACHSDCHENPARPPFLSQAGRFRKSFPVGETRWSAVGKRAEILAQPSHFHRKRSAAPQMPPPTLCNKAQWAALHGRRSIFLAARSGYCFTA